jgi:hypothetical protein
MGDILGDKLATYRAFSAVGIPMPKPIDGVTQQRVFSMERVGTNRPVIVVEGGQPIEPARLNTEFIDTSQEYLGKRYYICLRAMCVGPKPYAIIVRAAEVGENPSVRSIYTKLNPGLLNFLYEKVVVDRRVQIERICTDVAKLLGIGFYAHDLLPDSGSNKVFLCESGFKFEDTATREHFAPIAGELKFWDDIETGLEKAAALLAEQLS